MSTWRVGDSWITVSGLTAGTAGSKLAAQQDMFERKTKSATKAATKPAIKKGKSK